MTSPPPEGGGRWAGVHLDVAPSAAPAQAVERREEPFRILVAAGLRGPGTAEPGDAPGEDQPARGFVAVDRDNFNAVMASFSPALSAGALRSRRAAGKAPQGESPMEGVTLRFRALEDFEPDRLAREAPPLAALAHWRKELRDPGAGARLSGSSPTAGLTPPTAAQLAGLEGGSLLDQIVSDHPRHPSGDRLDRWLRDLVAPHLVPDRPPEQARLLADVEGAMAEQLRHLLHTPAFQALESTWRSIFLLVRRLETGVRLKVCLLDLPPGEAGPAALERELARPDPETGRPMAWGLVVVDRSFGLAPAPLRDLHRLARIGATHGVPVVAAADPSLAAVGTEGAPASPAEAAWMALRRSPEARFLGLTLPGFLVRLPWGAQGEPCDELPFFEEFPPGDGAPAHGSYLWAHGAWLVALVLGRAFAEGGWENIPGRDRRIEGLPLDVRTLNGVTEARPSTELLVTEGTAELLRGEGIIPLVAEKGAGTIHLPHLPSIADPPSRLGAG